MEYRDRSYPTMRRAISRGWSTFFALKSQREVDEPAKIGLQ